MKKTLLVLILFIFKSGFGQTAYIKLKNPVYSEKETTTPLLFDFNGQSFGKKDTIIQIKLNKTGFDACKVTSNDYILDFVTKFKENETYEIQQGCCCSDFNLVAEKNPKRGTVTFKNNTKKDLGFLVGIESDTVAKGKKKMFFATESAMCFFKPCDILITEAEYLSHKYDYDSDSKKDYKALSEEQEKFVLDLKWFHFLHGEKIEATYNPDLHKIVFKLKGYLTDKEYLKIINGDN